MTPYFALLAVFVSSSVNIVGGDYACICSYNPDIVVYSGPSNSSSELGHMFEFDCKAVGPSSSVDGWSSVQFNNQVGYVQEVENLQQQNCPGNIPASDLVTSTTAASTDTTNVNHSSASHHTKTTSPLPTTMSTENVTTDRTMTTPPMPMTTEETTTMSATPPMSTTTPSAATTTESTVTSPPPVSSMSTTTMSSTSATVSTSTDATIMSPSPVPGVQYGCAQNFFSHAASHHGKLFTIGQTCYELITETKSWSSAENDCKSRGGHLVHIENAEQQNKIYQIVGQYHGDHVWIGLNDQNTEEHFVWSSGDPVNYTHWYPDRKTSIPLFNEDCVAMWMTHAGQWEDVHCDGFFADVYGYVCEFDGVIEVPTTTLTSDTLMNTDGNTQLCTRMAGTTVAQFGKSCYSLYRDLQIWSHAEQTCRQSGGHLIHINDEQEQQYIEGFVTRHNLTTPVWIGLSDRAFEGRFVWADGASASYTNWLPGHVTHSSDEDCVALLPNKNGTWDDFSCGQTNFFGSEVGEQHHPLCEHATTISSVLVG